MNCLLLFLSSPGVDTVSSSQTFASTYRTQAGNVFTSSSLLLLSRPTLLNEDACVWLRAVSVPMDRNVPPHTLNYLPPHPFFLSLSVCLSASVSQISPTHSAPAPSSPSPSPPVTPSATHQEVRLMSFWHFSATSFCRVFSEGGKCSPHAFSSGLLTMLYSLFLRRWRWQEKKKVLRAHNSRLIEHKGQLYACFMRGFAVFVFFLYCFKLNIFGFWTVGQTEKDSGRWHLEYIRAPFLIFRNQNQENKMNISCGPQWLL